MTDVAKQLEQLQAEVARLNKMAKMTDEERVMMAEMTEDEQKAYMDGDEAMREQLKAKYTKVDEDEAEKADDEEDTTKALQKMQATVDETSKIAKALADENIMMKLEKRAQTELVGLTGDIPAKVSLLKALDGLQDADRTLAMDMLKKAAEICVSFTKSIGTSGEPIVAGDATTKLEAMAKAFAAEHKVTTSQAYAKLLRTTEGAKLYAETTKQ